jgi:tRNA nucleotidyltransferase (CCA-adding enzyme)
LKPGLRENVVAALPEALRPLLRRVIESAERGGFAVHLVGGPVRDFLLGVPVRDVDLVVEPRGGEGAPALAALAAPEGGRAVVHERFGTARLEGPAGSLDLATARSERYPHPGALPVVAPGSLEQDLRRRDFSVNALAIPLTRAAARGRTPVVDDVGGQADLAARRLRVLHERSFHDDPTRALRAARLAARLGFRLGRESLGPLRAALRDGAFGRVSGERLRRELEKLFEDAAFGLDPARALRLLDDWHVLVVVEPGLGLPAQAVQPLRSLGQLLREPPWPLARVRPWVPGLALWLAPLAPALRRRALRRFSVRGEAASLVGGWVKRRDPRLRALGRARGRGEIDRILGELGEEDLLALAACAPARLRRRIVRWAAEDRGRRAPVGGADFTGLGLSGPDVGRALASVRKAFLDGRVRSREEALTLAAELARRIGSTRPRPRRSPPAARA